MDQLGAFRGSILGRADGCCTAVSWVVGVAEKCPHAGAVKSLERSGTGSDVSGCGAAPGAGWAPAAAGAPPGRVLTEPSREQSTTRHLGNEGVCACVCRMRVRRECIARTVLFAAAHPACGVHACTVTNGHVPPGAVTGEVCITHCACRSPQQAQPSRPGTNLAPMTPQRSCASCLNTGRPRSRCLQVSAHQEKGRICFDWQEG